MGSITLIGDCGAEAVHCDVHPFKIGSAWLAQEEAGYRRISPVQRSKPRGNVPTNAEYFFDLFKRFA